MKARLWWADQDSTGESLIPKTELIRWFRESAKTLKSNPPPEILQPKRAARKSA